MSPINRPSARFQPTTAALPFPACDRLAHNRTLLASRAVLPLLFEGPHQHPIASLALGALAQALVQPLPAGSDQPETPQALTSALAVVRQRPKTTLAVAAMAGATCWRSRTRLDASSSP